MWRNAFVTSCTSSSFHATCRIERLTHHRHRHRHHFSPLHSSTRPAEFATTPHGGKRTWLSAHSIWSFPRWTSSLHRLPLRRTLPPSLGSLPLLLPADRSSPDRVPRRAGIGTRAHDQVSQKRLLVLTGENRPCAGGWHVDGTQTPWSEGDSV